MVSLSFAFTIKLRYCKARQTRVLVRRVHLALIRADFSATAPHQTGQGLSGFSPAMGG